MHSVQRIRPKVTNSDSFTKALAKIEELKKAAEDDAKVKAVIDAINALPGSQ